MMNFSYIYWNSILLRLLNLFILSDDVYQREKLEPHNVKIINSNNNNSKINNLVLII